MNWLARDDGIENFEFAVSDGLLAQRALPGAPLESLDYALLD